MNLLKPARLDVIPGKPDVVCADDTHPGPAWRGMNEYEPTWVKLNTARLWIDKSKKTPMESPSAGTKKKNASYPAEWKPRYGMGGAPRRCKNVVIERNNRGGTWQRRRPWTL